MRTVRLHIDEAFTVARPPEDVFAFMVEPENLPKWQTVKTYVTPLTEGPTRLGSRFREGTKVGLRRWDQVVDVTEFEPGRLFGVKVTEGPQSSGRWTMEADGAGTRVRFDGDFQAPRLLGPVVRRVMRRQFRGYHENLRRAVEAGSKHDA
jgi:uncharacterized protein YndB with AHSA1/START domain